MLFVVVLLSLVGTTVTSSLSKRGGGGGIHNGPLINCPTCEHHVCDSSNLIQCEVCQIYIPHENQPPEVVKCARAGHCYEDNHHHCCDNEGCVAHYFGQHVSSAVTQPVSSTGCPRCRLGRCDFNNRDQCSTCLIDLRDGRIPHVHCLREIEHCISTHPNTLCCSDESCIVQAFGHYYPTYHDTTTTESSTSTLPTNTTAPSTTTTPHSSNVSLTTTITTTNASLQTSSVKCPRCHEGICDFINRDQCSTCRIDLKNDGTHHVHCLKEHEHCDPTHHNTFCCSDEPCIVQAFGHYYPTSHDTTTTTESATSTFPTNSTAAATTTTPHSSNVSLTTTIPTTNASPQTNTTSTGGHKLNLTNQLLNYIPCPVCTHMHHTCDLANTNLCEVCQITFEHQLPRGTNCLTVDHHCRDDYQYLCCTDMACIENVFGNIPKSGASLNGNNIYCPECTIHGCNFISCETCVYHRFVYGTQLHKFKTCELKGACSHNDDICCHDYHCIDKLFGTHFQSTLSTIQSTTNPSITSKTTDRASTTKAHALSHATTNAFTTSGAATMATTSRQTTTTGTTTPNIATSVSSNGQPTHHVSGAATSTYRTITTRQQSTAPPTTTSSTIGTNNSCVDELKNCAMFKSMGVCHAIPQEGTKYDIAFQCKLTCDRCNETYEPLTTVASTIPTTIGTSQANLTSTDGHLPCPVCTHNICDRSNTILCEVCQITFNHQPQPQNAKCLNRGQCFEDDSNLCCTDLACVEIILKHLDAVTNYPLIQPEIHASIKRTPEESNIGDLHRENGEKKN